MLNSSRVTNKSTYNRRYTYFSSFTEAIPKLKKNKVCQYFVIYFMSKLGIGQLSFPENYMKSYACLNGNSNVPFLPKVHLSYSY